MLPNAGNSSPALELSSLSPFDCPCTPAVPGADIPGGGPGGCIPADSGPWVCVVNMPECWACEAYDDPPPSIGKSLVSKNTHQRVFQLLWSKSAVPPAVRDENPGGAGPPLATPTDGNPAGNC